MSCNYLFPECSDCINREHDPFQCDTCEDASNFEPEDDDWDDSAEQVVWMTKRAA